MEDVEALAVRPVLPRLEDGAGQDVDTEKPTKKEESSNGDREEETVADDDAVDRLVRAYRGMAMEGAVEGKGMEEEEEDEVTAAMSQYKAAAMAAAAEASTAVTT